MYILVIRPCHSYEVTNAVGPFGSVQDATTYREQVWPLHTRTKVGLSVQIVGFGMAANYASHEAWNAAKSLLMTLMAQKSSGNR